MSQNKKSSKKTKAQSSTRQRPTVFIHDGHLNYQTYGNLRRTRPTAPKKKRPKFGLLGFICAVVIGLVAYSHFAPKNNSGNQSQQSGSVASNSKTSPCTSNSQPQFIIVSISQRHMWVCQGSKQIYDNPVVTGMTKYAADTTPLGTYSIYGKETDTYLSGSDQTGSWDDFVNYWMPFLSNQYGIYGFHDATWRPSNAFGNINPSSNQASHGCVEMPLTAAAWLYNWVQVGTSVSIGN